MVTFEALRRGETAVAVVGLGYVGLPLAVALSEHFRVIGLDVSRKRVDELKSGLDRTREVEPDELARARVEYTADPAMLKQARVVLVAVPTPIDEYRSPDLRPITGASRTVGANLAPDSVVVYESTVYPGLTEDICVPILEKESGLFCGKDFFVGYSPERVNPGDKAHTLRTIVKVVAGQTTEVTLDLLADLYGTWSMRASTRLQHQGGRGGQGHREHPARPEHRLMNELAMIFDRMSIDTLEVLEAAGTKWNFLPFRPGLVGGHCIGVDPYYLTFKAEALGFHPQVILAGRRINDHISKFVVEAAVKRLMAQGRTITKGRVGVLGITFKENVPDLRNTRVVDMIREFADYGMEVLAHDPLADQDEAMEEYGLALSSLEEMRDLDLVVLAVNHRAYADLSPKLLAKWYTSGERLLVDIKGVFDRDELERAGFEAWRL